MNGLMTYDQLIAQIIVDGIAEVVAVYDDPEEHHKRDGAIEGFEACRGKTPSELVDLWVKTERETFRLGYEPKDDTRDLTSYWQSRYKALQIEFVLNVLSAALQSSGQPALMAHLPTARGAMKYAEICERIRLDLQRDREQS